jgi:hypothetical protein
MAVAPVNRSVRWFRVGSAVLSGEMRDDVFSEQPDRFHHLFVQYRPELLHAHHVIQSGDFVNMLDLLDAGVGATADHRAITQQVNPC